ncbi:MAG: cupin domain-containing protein [Gaiellaceae bacterium]
MAGLVVHENQIAEVADAAAGVCAKLTISSETTGHLSQAVLRILAGSAGTRVVPEGHEEILYVLRGEGAVVLGDVRHDLGPDTGAHVASGETYRLESSSDEDLVAVSVIAPVATDLPVELGERQTVVRLADQPAHPAGKDRKFWFVVTPEVGCRGVTQFVGWIPPGRAKDHYHEYDEVAYILEGDAVLHREGEPDVKVGPGSCIHFPPGMVHCVENVGEAPVRVLGVFHPPGSAAAAYHPDDD